MHLRDRAVIGILSLVLIGLTGAVVAPSLSPEGPDATPASSTVPPRPYVEGVVGMAASVSPFSARSSVERQIETLLFRGLVRLGPDDTLLGDLAEGWEVDASGAAWTFHLRPGLTWQDGSPLTSDDVVFTIRTLADSAYAGPGAASWQGVSASARDAVTVTLTLATPLGGFLEAATQPIAPAHLLDGVNPADLPQDPFGQHPVGSTAFRLATLDDAHAVLVPAVPDTVASGPDGPGPTPLATDSIASARPSILAGAPLPYLDAIEFRFFSDEASLTAAWGRGELDSAAGIQGDVADQLVAAGGAHVLRYPATTLLGVILNQRAGRTEFRDPAVRRALLQATDRDAIVTTVLAGYAGRADSLIPPTSWVFDAAASPPVAHDAKAAADALVAAGWKRVNNGSWIPKGASEPLVIDLLSPEAAANPAAYAVADAIAADWRALGLTVTRHALPADQLLGEHLQVGDFSAAVIATGIGLDPDVYPLLASTQVTASGSNFSGLQDPALDKLLSRARAPGADDVRLAAYAELQAKLQAGTYVLPIAFRDVVVVVRDGVSGPQVRPLGGPGDRFWDVLTWRLADGR